MQALAAEADRTRGVIMAEAEHRALTAQLTDLAVLRESNTALRCDLRSRAALNLPSILKSSYA